MAVGSKYKCTVGDVVNLHEDEVRQLISELAAAVTLKVLDA